MRWTLKAFWRALKFGARVLIGLTLGAVAGVLISEWVIHSDPRYTFEFLLDVPIFG
ncbi:MAG: hypothetical protein AAFO93_15470 [Pseudomonadota bacterium]